MEKKSLIEEMARDICGNAIGKICILDKKECNLKCSYSEIAETTYNAGYRKQSEWISVEERLPESETGAYLGYGYYNDTGHGKINLVYFFYGKWDVLGDFVVTHWMPLPTPPNQ